MKTFALLIIVMVWATPSLCLAQGKTASEDTPFECSDDLVWNGQKYYINKSPIIDFAPKHEKIFDYNGIPFVPDLNPGPPPVKGPNPEDLPPFRDKKPYSIIWKIVGDRLYMTDLYFFTLNDPPKDLSKYFILDDNEPYMRMEKLTGLKFIRGTAANNADPIGPYGVMPATWFSGVIYARPHNKERPFNYNVWKKYPITKLTFKAGRLVSSEILKDI